VIDLKTIAIPSEDVVWVAGSLYCKTPKALQAALKKLRAVGYTIQDNRTDGFSVRTSRATPEQMEGEGWSLWYASLDDISRGKCKSCNSYISRRGIQMHGHKCEVCGEATYYDMVEGSTIKFAFEGEDRGLFSPDLRMTVKRWDTDEGWLYLLWEFNEGSWGIMNPEQAEAYLAKHADKWMPVEEDGQQLIKLRYHLHHMGDPINPETVIDPIDIWGHHFNYGVVKLWEGREYSEYDRDFPIPESISIYEAWHWAPLEQSPTLHERLISAVGQVSDAGYYYQDGRPAWSYHTYEEMGKFVRHFTTLDADEWDRVSPQFRLDGPGGIADVAAFCHPDAIVENKPNIGNFLVAMGDVASGRMPDPGTAAAASRALAEDPDTQEFAEDLKRGLFRRRK
jgi:hypothetical protein